MPPRHSIDNARHPELLNRRQIRAIQLSRELHMWNTIRFNHAWTMHSQTYQQSSPAFQAAYLMGIAQIDQYRRSFRELLRDALDAL